MIHTHQFSGVTVRTGDILFTRDGTENSLFGALWNLFGNIIPGDLDHCMVYVGPGVRFIESAARGVVLIEMVGDDWNPEPCAVERLMVDTLVAVGDPTAGRELTSEQQTQIRENAVAFCMEQVRKGKPYNVDFFDPETDGAFYCSQLVYKAYQSQGINLHPTDSVNGLLYQSVVLPEELWNACLVRQRLENAAEPQRKHPDTH